MAIDDTPHSIFSPWPDRLRHSALILLAAALALSVVNDIGLIVEHHLGPGDAAAKIDAGTCPTSRYARLVGSARRRTRVIRNTEPASRMSACARGLNMT